MNGGVAEAVSDANASNSTNNGCRLYLDDLVVRLDRDRRYADIGIVEVEDYEDAPSEEPRLNPSVDWLCSGATGELDPTQVAATPADFSNHSGAEPVVSIVDRAFSTGDAVRWANDEAGQAGTVEATRRQCHLYVPGYSRLIAGVSADRILCGNFIDELGRQSVQYDGWYGSVQSISRELVELKFVDGSVIRAPAHVLEYGDTRVIGDFSANQSHPFCSDRLYRGAFVELHPGVLHTLRSEIQWIRFGSNPAALRRAVSRRRLVAEVISVKPSSFEVDWHFCFPCLTVRPLGDLPKELEASRLLACNPAIGSDRPAVVDRLTLGCFAYLNLRQDDRVFQVEPHTSLGCVLYELMLGGEQRAASEQLVACEILPAVAEASGDETDTAEAAAAVAAACCLDGAADFSADSSDGAAGSAPPAVARAPTRFPVSRRRRGGGGGGGGGFGRNGGRGDRRVSDGRGGGGGRSEGGGGGAEGDAVLQELQKRALRSGQLLAVQVVSCSTRVDVRWQDGRLQTDISSCDLVPFDDFMESQFFPGDFVLSSQQQLQLEADIGDGSNPASSSMPDRYGLVLENDVRQKLARVQWFREGPAASTATGGASEPLGQPELVSTIDLKEYPIYEYRPRTIVMLKSQQLVGDQPEAAAASPPGPIQLGDVVRVVLETGKIRVAWLDGQESDLWPSELFSLEGLLSGGPEQRSASESSSFFNNFEADSDDNESWETESEETAEPDEADRVGIVVQVTSGGDVVAMATEGDDEMGGVATAANSNCWLPHHASCSDEWACARQVGVQLREPLRLIADCLREAVNANACRTVTSTVVHSIHQALDTILLTAHGLRTQLHDLRSRPSCLCRNATASQRQALLQFSSHLRHLTADTGCLEAFTDPEAMPDKLAPLRHALTLRRPDEQLLVDQQQRVVPTFVPRVSNPLSDSLRRLWQSATSLMRAGPDLPPAELDTDAQLDVPDYNAMQEMMQLLYGQVRLRMGSQLTEATRNNLEFFRGTICRVMQVEIAEVAVPESTAGTGTADQEQTDRQASNPASASKPAARPTASPAAEGGAGTFLLVECAPPTHLHYAESAFSSSGLPPKAFISAWRRELALLGDHLPRGVTVKAYEDRMDLMAVLIEGPAGTPYSGALFLFDLHLPTAYPAQPPRLLYRSMCSGRLNPNLYECGKVCVSLLGTWDGQGTERWAPGESNLLQVLVSVQGLILVEEPLFNEPGYEKGTQAAAVKSREYNELAVVRTAQSMASLVSSPPDTFAAEVGRYAETRLRSYADQLADWLADRGRPGFPLLPLSAGAKLSLTAVVRRLTELADKVQGKQ
ncbi:hypothetical protein BOX15_Mlig022576g4 [Macrostomum lignano]|uniref:UBC core domain-containing protein n=1 Tax=Macrostomum lignano TaxID=282301 RepID=A0A267ECP0_9PLAT|nr:hypothetical protein BOX15_Mlig022576g4 [Macrostomum lignano]